MCIGCANELASIEAAAKASAPSPQVVPSPPAQEPAASGAKPSNRYMMAANAAIALLFCCKYALKHLVLG